MERSSEVSGLYKLSREKKLEIVQARTGLTDDEMKSIKEAGGLPIDIAERMAENVIGWMTLPLGVATNFRVNGRDFLVPMSTEEPSVIAAASNAAKMARKRGGFLVRCRAPVMIGQVQVVKIQDPDKARTNLLQHKREILELANARHSLHIEAKDVEVRILDSKKGVRAAMVIVELVVNTGDAMGANAVNKMAESVAPLVEQLSGGKVYLRIVSNLADRRLVTARAVFDKSEIGGDEVVDGVLYAYAFADADPYRCATHNKGIMNGVVAVGIACGQDTRALEAGAHSYAARNGAYKPLTTWKKNPEGNLVGRLEMPMAVGLVGGALDIHPAAKAAIKILGVKSASELARVIAAVGLAQNFAALRALASEGIQMGHAKIRARDTAVSAGADG